MIRGCPFVSRTISIASLPVQTAFLMTVEFSTVNYVKHGDNGARGSFEYLTVFAAAKRPYRSFMCRPDRFSALHRRAANQYTGGRTVMSRTSVLLRVVAIGSLACVPAIADIAKL